MNSTAHNAKFVLEFYFALKNQVAQITFDFNKIYSLVARSFRPTCTLEILYVLPFSASC